MKVLAVRLCVALLAGACAGAAPREDRQDHERVLAMIASGDPLFGGGAFVEQRLFASPSFVAIGDPTDRDAFVQRVRRDADSEALALACELVSAEVAADVHEFVVSAPNAALWNAEALALAGYPMPADDFAAQTARAYGDPARVGTAALDVVRGLAAGDDYSSTSPPRLAIELGAMRVKPEEARAIAAFAATSVGANWIALRNAALQRSQQRFQAILAEARAAGLVRDLFDELPPLDLPLPTNLDEPSAVSAYTLRVDVRGMVHCGALELANVSSTDELRAALRRLRERGVAEGKLSLHEERWDGVAVSVVAESIGITASEGVPWRQIEALLQLLSEPGIAFWKVEVDVDPKVVPESLRGSQGR